MRLHPVFRRFSADSGYDPMPRFPLLYSAAAAVLAAALAGCASTPLPPAPPPQRLPPAPATTISPPSAGISRAQLEAAGNACEKVVANAVKTRYPEPGSVMLMPDRERILQHTASQTAVSGEGTFEPDASASAMSFQFTCVYNFRTQRVDDVQMKYGAY